MDLNNVAAHYERMERFDEAQRFYAEAKAVFERLPNGDKEPDYALVLNNLGLLYFDQGKLAEAESLLHVALEIREAHYGSKHQYVAETLVNLAELSLQETRTEDALELFQRALAILQYTLGPDHPETQEARQDYAAALRQNGQLELAEAIERNAIN
jgi:tetratricopeptide (TPR) repeat protein